LPSTSLVRCHGGVKYLEYYGSDDWKRGPRNTIMGLVEHFAYTVVSVETWKKISAGLNTKKIQ